VERVLGKASGIDDLGMRFGADLTAVELHYLMTKEWARTADDVLWRRSKLGLKFSDEQRAALDRYMVQAGAAGRAGSAAQPR
jgi:glycerol-3-phosphate dehydrogenase